MKVPTFVKNTDELFELENIYIKHNIGFTIPLT